MAGELLELGIMAKTTSWQNIFVLRNITAGHHGLQQHWASQQDLTI